MSDITEPVIERLLTRQRELQEALSHAAARLAEVDHLITMLGGGRSRVRRLQRKPREVQAPPFDMTDPEGDAA